MIIREASDTDVPAIVELLKLSLGESLMPKSEAFWYWKHMANPFGSSPVLVAEEDDKLIGVRAFMRWEWRQQDKIYKAVRAVDTATHPAYQGKGIFKKLTLGLVDYCKKEGVSFVFNTPNKSSKPGYLKMGWHEAGRLKIYMRPSLAIGRKRAENFETCYSLIERQGETAITSLPLLIHNSSEYVITNTSALFLKWRYQQNPNVRYYGFTDDQKSYGVIFRLKPSRFGYEFRICEMLLTSNVHRSEFKNHLLMVFKESGATLITYAGSHFPLLSFQALPIGPMVTIRPLTMVNSLSFDQWKPSLGDMEVF